MDSQIIILFVSALIAGIAGSEAGHKFKHLNRTINGRLAVHFCSGFSGALLALIILSSVEHYQLPLASIIGVSYGYFMANAKAYHALR